MEYQAFGYVAALYVQRQCAWRQQRAILGFRGRLIEREANAVACVYLMVAAFSFAVVIKQTSRSSSLVFKVPAAECVLHGLRMDSYGSNVKQCELFSYTERLRLYSPVPCSSLPFLFTAATYDSFDFLWFQFSKQPTPMCTQLDSHYPLCFILK